MLKRSAPGPAFAAVAPDDDPYADPDGGRLRWGYDPAQHGALCSQCSLNGRVVVPSELRPSALFFIVAEAPGRVEEQLGFPLCGPSGQETERALEACGLRRGDVSLGNVMCCRQPEKSYEMHQRSVRRRNKERKARGLPPLLLPHEACRPRLLHELRQAHALVLIGKIARQAVLGLDKEEERRRQTLRELEEAGAEPVETDEFGEERAVDPGAEREERIPGRGFPGVAWIDGRDIPCLTTVHPAYVLRKRRWTDIFRSDLAKAARMARGKLHWVEPQMLFFPRPYQLRDFLTHLPATELVAYDTETDGLEPTEVHLRCLGLGTKDACTCVPFRSVESRPEWHHTADERAALREILLAWFGDAQGRVVAQNEKYDRAVLRHCGELPGFVMRRAVFDTAIGHHLAFSEWAHDLDTQIAQYLDAPHHKGKNHDKWTSDRQLHHYCMLDVARTAEVAGHLLREPALHAQPRAFAADLALSTFCRELGEIGMRLDVTERDRLYAVQTVRAGEKEQEARKFAVRVLEQAGKLTPTTRKLAEVLNPNSPKQVGRLIYEVVGLEPAPAKDGGYTETDEPSTREDVLYYLIDRGLPRDLESMMLAIIDYRGAIKLRGTYCTVQPRRDGRVRSTWNPHVVVSGRLSCSKPNLMNLAPAIRTMYCCEPGHVLVMCDKAQLEARIIAELAQDERWIQAFLAGKDIHRVNACDLFDLKTIEAVSKSLRQFAKTLVYAGQYGAGLKKRYQMVKSYVDPLSGDRPYRHRTLNEIAACCQRFDAQHQAIIRYHATGLELFKQQKYLEDAIDGRRRYFLDGAGDEGGLEELKNFRIQSCLPGSTMILTRLGYVPIGEAPLLGEVWTGTKWAAYRRIDREPNDIGELELANGQILRCDTNHQVLVVGEKDYEFRHWNDLRVGDRVCLSLAYPVPGGNLRVEHAQACRQGERVRKGQEIPEEVWRYDPFSRAMFLVGVLGAKVRQGREGHTWWKSAYPEVGVGPLDPTVARQLLILFRAGGVVAHLDTEGVLWVDGRMRTDLLSGLNWFMADCPIDVYQVSLSIPQETVTWVPPAVGLEFNRRVPVGPTGREFKSQSVRRLRQGHRVNPYRALQMLHGGKVYDLPVYDWAILTDKRLTGTREPVYTLSVDDPGHRFDSEGVISKNTAAADVNAAVRRVCAEFPPGFAGPYTGIVHYAYDSLALETKAERALTDGARLVELMSSYLGRMPLPVDLAIGPNYGKKTEYVRRDGVWVAKG